MRQGLIKSRYIPRDPAGAASWDEVILASLGKSRGALVDVGANRLGLIGASDQFLLLDRFRQQSGAGIDRKLIEQSLGSADRIRALSGDLARNLEGRSTRVIADARRKPVRQRLLGREYPA